MTKKTRLHARATQKTLNTSSTHKRSTTPAKIGVAASVAIASTLAMAQVAQAKTAKSEELVQAQAQTLPTPTGEANTKGEQPAAGASTPAAPVPATPVPTTPTPASTSEHPQRLPQVHLSEKRLHHSRLRPHPRLRKTSKTRKTRLSPQTHKTQALAIQNPQITR